MKGIACVYTNTSSRSFPPGISDRNRPLELTPNSNLGKTYICVINRSCNYRSRDKATHGRLNEIHDMNYDEKPLGLLMNSDNNINNDINNNNKTPTRSKGFHNVSGEVWV